MLVGCGVKQSVEDADVQVGAFHKQLDAEQYDTIWNRSAPEMKKAVSETQLTKLLAAVHRKLGKVRSSKQVGWNANTSTNGSFVTVTMQTTFERGTGTEALTFRKEQGNRLMLAGYNINSQDMMLN